jgi:hypothetical protein
MYTDQHGFIKRYAVAVLGPCLGLYESPYADATEIMQIVIHPVSESFCRFADAAAGKSARALTDLRQPPTL